MNAPLFSIIVPTFNSGAKLAATTLSVLSQEPDLYELIVIDGGSTDDTLGYLRAQGSALRWVSEPDRGIYDAMNKGLRLSSGRFLYFIGAGDCLRAGILRAVANLLPINPDGPLFVYGNVNWPAAGGVYGGVFDASRLTRQNICHQAIFHDRAIFDLLGEYDLRYRTCADFAMNIRCFGHPAIRKVHLDLIVADYEGGGASSESDPIFCADWASLSWKHLGVRAGLETYLRHSNWLVYQWRQPLRSLPARIIRRARAMRILPP